VTRLLRVDSLTFEEGEDKSELALQGAELVEEVRLN